MKLSFSRPELAYFDPTPSNEEERFELHRFLAAFDHPEHPALVDALGVRTELPENIYQLLLRLKRMIEQNQVIALIPQQQQLTTQAAANLVGVSRPHFVSLLEAGKIPYSFAGRHRRVALNDLVEYMADRDQRRHEALNRMTEAVENAGLYELDYSAKGESGRSRIGLPKPRSRRRTDARPADNG